MFLLRYRYNPRYTADALNDASNILYIPYRIRHTTRPKEGLWWTVTANTMPSKSVVRTWAQRRLRVAFVKALETQGWDREGKVIAEVAPPDRDGLNAKKKKKKERRDLKGTLEIYTLTKILQATGEEVQREAKTLVEIVAGKCRS